jgi:transposase
MVMGKSYSTDLRERVLGAIDEGLSKAQAHCTFHISRSTINHWFSLREQTGCLDPLPPRSTRTRQLEGKEFEAFAQGHQAQGHQHATLGEMAVAWQQEQGVSLSLMSFSRALGKLGWTRKKELVLQRARRSRARSLGQGARSSSRWRPCLCR